MAEEKGRYGTVIAKTKLNHDIPITISVSESPFGEQYLIVSTVDDIMVSGLSIEKKRTGTIEFRQKVNSVINIGKDSAAEEPVKKDRTL